MGKVLFDRGDSELWRCSCLRWFNLILGIVDIFIVFYIVMIVNENCIGCFGCSIMIDEGIGLFV